jgi:septal ring factor EnvC (AmiA/AmiB activator)
LEAGGAEYRLKKEEVERISHLCSDLEKLITRMKTNLGNTEANLLRLDKEIEKEQREITKLEEANKKLKDETDKNTQLGEKLLAEMQAIEEEKKSNRE